MAVLIAVERACVDRFVTEARQVLGDELRAAVLFGSAARDELWPADSPMHSDLDVLLLTRAPVPPSQRSALVDATYPLFLECGRQISPQFFELPRWEAPGTEVERNLVTAVTRDGVDLYRAE